MIGESDCRGMAGLQGDVKTIIALGGYSMTATTAIAAHGPGGIQPLHSIPPEVVGQQIETIIKNSEIDAVKVGFLQSETIVNIVADALDGLQAKKIPIIVDPSIISRSGNVLMDDQSLSTLKRRLYVHTTVLTPNLREAELLGVMKIMDIDDMRHAADMMRTLGVENVVLKGGRAESDKELYFVATPDKEQIYQRPIVQTPHTLGAGNVLSSALAVNFSRRVEIFSAVEHALDFLHQAIAHSTGFGYEVGPVNHAFDIETHSHVFHPETIKVYKI